MEPAPAQREPPPTPGRQILWLALLLALVATSAFLLLGDAWFRWF